jgi:hypothetical protein
MEYSRFLECLAADFARLRGVVPANPAAPVPSCPGWSVADLTRHVGEVYLHKTLAMREGAEPDPWPPAELAGEEPLALLDRAYAGMRAEFAAASRPIRPAPGTPRTRPGDAVRPVSRPPAVRRRAAR